MEQATLWVVASPPGCVQTHVLPVCFVAQTPHSFEPLAIRHHPYYERMWCALIAAAAETVTEFWDEDVDE